MLIVSSHIQIRDWLFDHCVDCEIVSDINSLTDTCKITIPRRYRWKGKDIAMGDDPYIKRKDKVVVQMGYDGKLKTQFVGYVKNIKAGVPVTIECEDSMFLLKQEPIEKLTLRPGLKLEKWLDILLPDDMKRVVSDVEMGALRVSKKTPSEVLEWIKNNYGLQFYFRLNSDGEPVLYAGLAYSQLAQDRKELTYRFGSNIIDANDLVYRRQEDVRLKIKAIGVKRNNTRTEVSIGDADGEIRTVHYYEVDVDTLKKRAQEDLNRFKYTGYRGSFMTFGEPSIRIGDIASIVGNDYNPDGKYLVSKVTKRIGVTTGYKQTIEPQQIVNPKGINTTVSP
jgi:hypothetical protein